MAFMLGLSVGTILADKIFRLKLRNQMILKAPVFILLIILALLNFFLKQILNFNIFSGLAGISILLLIAGVLIAGIFSHASLFKLDNQLKAVAPIYSADVLGGSLGALPSTFLLIPFLGIIQTGIFLCMLSFLSVILL